MRESRVNFISKGLQCLCRKGPDFDRQVPANKRPKRLKDTPLAVFAQGKYCSTAKLELALKTQAGFEGYDVKSADGQPCFRVERKLLSQWNKRVVSNMKQEPVCTIERDEKSGNFKIWAHAGQEQVLAVEIRERWSFKSNLKKSKEELRVTLVGAEHMRHPFLRICGQFKRREFGITWGEDFDPSDSLVATGSGLGFQPVAPSGSEKQWYTMEIPAGVDAALMVALGVLLGEVITIGFQTTGFSGSHSLVDWGQFIVVIAHMGVCLWVLEKVANIHQTLKTKLGHNL